MRLQYGYLEEGPPSGARSLVCLGKGPGEFPPPVEVDQAGAVSEGRGEGRK